MSKFSFPLSGGSPSTLKFLTCNQQVDYNFQPLFCIFTQFLILISLWVLVAHGPVGLVGPLCLVLNMKNLESSQFTWSCFPQVSFFSLVPLPSSFSSSSLSFSCSLFQPGFSLSDGGSVSSTDYSSWPLYYNLLREQYNFAFLFIYICPNKSCGYGKKSLYFVTTIPKSVQRTQ